MRSLSAETNTYFVRILLTISPRLYREALALCIHLRRPDFDVLLAPPWPLDRRAERFEPHVLVQDAEEAGLPPALAGAWYAASWSSRSPTASTPPSNCTGRPRSCTMPASRTCLGYWRRPRDCRRGTAAGRAFPYRSPSGPSISSVTTSWMVIHSS